ncbi:MAG: carbon-nitrogen hydrolase family protein [Bacteroidota bacterium]|nr:carbon-nitrogen hydrolase family protein [Bacteroidota bacterium]MDP4234110.1 carbon-nitrogen hydrolase family protein [Bacteroidota bacterium]MDP4243051.1 carbon-nitrogen hydrolase family protein [Bacteroidota bacterium]MDP4287477.1 carbon-nitrogen hydrolase family protein [Bacteroidota bacterium]
MPKVRVATVSFLMEDTPHTVEMNLERARMYIRDASEQKADIVCLPETVTTNGLANPIDSAKYSDAWMDYFADAAKKYGIAVIAPFFVRDITAVYNQATVFNRDGSCVDHYRKLQPTGIEAKSVTPGWEFPIIDLGFAKITVMICMDIYFPEIARIYAMKGAELLFWPTTTHGPTQSGLEAQLRSRAIDNSMWIVESNLAGHQPYAPYDGRFYPGNARVMDFNGDIIAETGRRAGLAVCDIDLDERRTTSQVLLIHEPDDTRADLESLARMDLYAKEYSAIAARQNRYYDMLRPKR